MFTPEENNQLAIDHVGKAYLLETVRWTKFMAILGFIAIGLLFLLGLFLITLMPSMSMPNGYGGRGITGALRGITFIIFTVLYFYPVFALSKFSSNMKTAINGNSQTHLNDALRYQKSMYKYIGILTIIVLIFYALIILFAGVVLGTFAAGA
ncbi:MAG: DUF5362 family protein [Flavipsychrobacter sp.]